MLEPVHLDESSTLACDSVNPSRRDGIPGDASPISSSQHDQQYGGHHELPCLRQISWLSHKTGIVPHMYNSGHRKWRLERGEVLIKKNSSFIITLHGWRIVNMICYIGLNAAGHVVCELLVVDEKLIYSKIGIYLPRGIGGITLVGSLHVRP